MTKNVSQKLLQFIIPFFLALFGVLLFPLIVSAKGVSGGEGTKQGDTKGGKNPYTFYYEYHSDWNGICLHVTCVKANKAWGTDHTFIPGDNKEIPSASPTVAQTMETALRQAGIDPIAGTAALRNMGWSEDGGHRWRANGEYLKFVYLSEITSRMPHTLDLNAQWDNTNIGWLRPVATADVYINGVYQGRKDDWYGTCNVNTTYAFTNVQTIAGWQYDGTVNNNTSGTVGSNDIDVRMKFSRKQYKVYFDGNGGTVNYASDVNSDKSITLTYGAGGYCWLGTNASREGYVFDGWYDKDGNPVWHAPNAYGYGYPVNGSYWSGQGTDATQPGASWAWQYTASSDLTVYAHWRPKHYYYHVNTEGGTGGQDPAYGYTWPVTYDQCAFSFENTPTREGYEFEGYYTRQGGKGQRIYKVYPGWMTHVIGDVDSTHWRNPQGSELTSGQAPDGTKYDVTYNTYDGADGATIELYAYWKDVTAPGDKDNPTSNRDKGLASVTFTAVPNQWSAGNGTISFQAHDSGSGIGSVTIERIALSAENAETVLFHKTYNGEKTVSETITEPNEGVFRYHLIVKDRWGNTATKDSDTIYLDHSAPKIHDLDKVPTDWTNRRITIAPTADDYLDSTWYSDDTSGSGRFYLDANGGTGSRWTTTIKYLGDDRIYPLPTRSGYIFNGFYTEPAGGMKVINADGTMTGDGVYSKYDSVWHKCEWLLTSDVTVYAQWSYAGEDTGLFHINANGGYVLRDTIPIRPGTRTSIRREWLPVNSATFMGLYTTPWGDGTKVVNSDGTLTNDGFYSRNRRWHVASDVTLYARWMPEAFTGSPVRPSNPYPGSGVKNIQIRNDQNQVVASGQKDVKYTLKPSDEGVHTWAVIATDNVGHTTMQTVTTRYDITAPKIVGTEITRTLKDGSAVKFFADSQVDQTTDDFIQNSPNHPNVSSGLKTVSLYRVTKGGQKELIDTPTTRNVFAAPDTNTSFHITYTAPKETDATYYDVEVTDWAGNVSKKRFTSIYTLLSWLHTTIDRSSYSTK